MYFNCKISEIESIFMVRLDLLVGIMYCACYEEISHFSNIQYIPCFLSILKEKEIFEKEILLFIAVYQAEYFSVHDINFEDKCESHIMQTVVKARETLW